MEAPTAAPDITALRACWHPVAFAAELDDKPLGRMLLGEPLALYRDSGGTARTVSDLCIHRGTAISLGWIDGDEIVCPYHGWHYGTDGACTLIPQLADPTRIPKKARIGAFRCVESHGLVWVALEDPRWPLPDVAARMTDKAGLNRLDALHAAVKAVRCGGTVSVSGVYGGEWAGCP